MALKTVTCCSIVTEDAPIDVSQAGSAKGFLERIGVLRANRNPEPRIQPGHFRVHEIPLTPPLPLPELQSHFSGEPPPDQGQTLHWPHPDLERAAEEAGA